MASDGAPGSTEIDIFANTITHELSIRSSVFSVIGGSIIGGFFGACANLIQFDFYADEINLAISFKVILSVILSVVSVIFMARKSDNLSFVSIEDFWGGILIGFLVGYSGLSFFEQLTGIQPGAFPDTESGI